MNIARIFRYLSTSDIEHDAHQTQGWGSLLKIKQLIHSSDKKTKALRESFYKMCRDRGLSDDPDAINSLLMQHRPSLGIADGMMLFLAITNEALAPYLKGGDTRPMVYEAIIKNMGSLDVAQLKKNILYLQRLYLNLGLIEHESTFNALLSGISGVKTDKEENAPQVLQSREMTRILGAHSFRQQCSERIPTDLNQQGTIDETTVVAMILKELEQFIDYTNPNNNALNDVLEKFQEAFNILCAKDEEKEAEIIIDLSTRLRQELSQKIEALSFDHQDESSKTFSKNAMQIIQAKIDYARANLVYWKMPKAVRPQIAWKAYQQFHTDSETSPIPSLDNLYQQKKEQEKYLKIDAAAKAYLATLDPLGEGVEVTADPIKLAPYVAVLQTIHAKGISGFWNRRSRLEKIGICIGGLLVVVGLGLLTGGAAIGFAALGVGIAGAFTGAFVAIATAAGGGALGTAAAVAGTVGVGLITTASVGGMAYAVSSGMDMLSSSSVASSLNLGASEEKYIANHNQTAAFASLSQSPSSKRGAEQKHSPKQVEQKQAASSAPKSENSESSMIPEPDDSGDKKQLSDGYPNNKKGSFGG